MYIYLLYFYVALSVIALLAYAIDKHRARKHRNRISEAFLLIVGLLGGSFGALLAMRVFRHKTRHWYFWGLNILGMLAQSGLLFWLWYMGV